MGSHLWDKSEAQTLLVHSFTTPQGHPEVFRWVQKTKRKQQKTLGVIVGM